MRTNFRLDARILAFSALIVGLLSAGCATKNKYALAPAEAPALEEAYFYKVGPGDSVEIFVWGNAELSGSFPVRPDGMITTRLVEDIPASGKTPTQLARDLEKVYSDYVRSPVVTVIVGGFVGIPEQQIRVVGEASAPMNIPYKKHMTLLDLMIAVGGVTEFADGNSTVLVRYAQGGEEKYNVHLDDLLKDGDISANVNLLPGDILIIPEAWF